MPRLLPEGGISMLKGTSRRVIEVRSPENAFFDRAVLYLRPEVTALQAAQYEAGRFLPQAPRRSGWGSFLAGALVSAAVFGLVLYFYG